MKVVLNNRDDDTFDLLFEKTLGFLSQISSKYVHNIPEPLTKGSFCYVRIPKESGRCRERKVRGSEACLADSY